MGRTKKRTDEELKLVNGATAIEKDKEHSCRET